MYFAWSFSRLYFRLIFAVIANFHGYADIVISGTIKTFEIDEMMDIVFVLSKPFSSRCYFQIIIVIIYDVSTYTIVPLYCQIDNLFDIIDFYYKLLSGFLVAAN